MQVCQKMQTTFVCGWLLRDTDKMAMVTLSLCRLVLFASPIRRSVSDAGVNQRLKCCARILGVGLNVKCKEKGVKRERVRRAVAIEEMLQAQPRASWPQGTRPQGASRCRRHVLYRGRSSSVAACRHVLASGNKIDSKVNWS